MRWKANLAAAILGALCISAAEAPANYRTYGGGAIESDPLLLSAYDAALRKCVPEALAAPRGNPEPASLHYNAALRACLYRQGFFDRGSFAYPATLVFDHFLDR